MTRFQASAKVAVTAAQWEARRAGAHRVGVEHLLVALLDLPDHEVADLVGTDATSVRVAMGELDRAALLAVGIVAPPVAIGPPRPTTGHLGLTTAFRDVMVGAHRSAKAAHARSITQRHLLGSLLAAPRPNPALDVLTEIGVDLAVVRRRLADAA